MTFARRILDMVISPRRAGRPTVPAAVERARAPLLEEDILQCPPREKGLPVIPVQGLFDRNAGLIGDIRGLFPFHDQEFDYLLWPVIMRLARLAHLLPASDAAHHSGAGGFFRHSLEVGFFAGRGSGDILFMPHGEPRERRGAEIRWQVCCFLAGLLHDIGKLATDLEIRDAPNGRRWHPSAEPLLDWCERQGLDRYYLSWTAAPAAHHGDFTAEMLPHVMPVELVRWINLERQEECYAQLRAVLYGRELKGSPIHDLVIKADASSCGRERQSVATPPPVSIPDIVIRTMRHLVGTGAWTVNRADSRIFLIDDGAERHLFIRWKQAVPDIAAHAGGSGIPGDPDSLAEIIAGAGYAVARVDPKDGQTHRYWPVAPGCLNPGGASVRKYLMLKLAGWHLLSGAAAPDAMAGEIDPPPPPAQGQEPATVAKARGRTKTDRKPRPAGQSVPVLLPPASVPSDTTDVQDVTDCSRTAGASLTALGDAGAVLLRIADGIAGGRQPVDKVLVRAQGHLVLLYPQGLRDCLGLALPGGADTASLPALVRLLDGAGLILLPDPMAPAQPIWSLPGTRGLVLRRDVASLLMSAAGGGVEGGA